MAIYQENNILFTNVIKPSFTTSGRIAKGKYTLDGSNNIITKPGPVINAIDIDWNGAQLDNNLIINSSSDLLSRLNNTYTKNELDNLYQEKGNYLTEHQSLEGLATEEYVNERIFNLINESPQALDTLNELSQALGNDPNFATTITNQLSNKANTGDSYTKNESDNKYQEKGNYLTEHQSLDHLATKEELNNLTISVDQSYYFYIGANDDNSVISEDYIVDVSGCQMYNDINSIIGNHTFNSAQYIVIPEIWYNQVVFKNSMDMLFDYDAYLVLIDNVNYVIIKSFEQLVNNLVIELLNIPNKVQNSYSKEESDLQYQQINNSINEINYTIATTTESLSDQINNLNVYSKEESDEKYVTIEAYNSLLQRFESLLARFNELYPEPKPYTITNGKPTAESIAELIDPNATKPTEEVEIDMNELSGPTTQYIVYPVEWEIVENDQLISPVILDENGFEMGVWYDEDSPTIEVNGIVYRILDTELGQGTYTINFR